MSPLDSHHLLGLGTLGTGRDLELHALTLGQIPEARHLDRGVVNEDLLAVIGLDESVSLGAVEPLNDALSHLYYLLLHAANCARLGRRTSLAGPHGPASA